MHSLDSAFRKLSRAIHHRAEANRLIKAFVKTRPYSIHSKTEPQTRDKVWYLDNTPRTPPLSISIAVGEAVYNLRSALDHLAWQLVVVNGNQPNVRTAFPISDHPAYWDRWWKNKTTGMNCQAVALIKEYQPCFQTQHYLGLWASWLEALSNIDKHRHAYITLSGANGGLFSHPVPFAARWSIHQGSIEANTELARIEEAHSDVEYGFFAEVAFAKGEPAADEMVTQTLRGLEVLVERILTDFGNRFFSQPLPTISRGRHRGFI